MKSSHYLAIGIPIGVLMIVAFLLLNFGYCVLISCETSVEIIEVNFPDGGVQHQELQADFTVKNTGINDAVNCAIQWNVEQFVNNFEYSEKFSLSPQQEKELTLNGNVIGSHGGSCIIKSEVQMRTSARVHCDNVMSETSSEPFIFECN